MAEKVSVGELVVEIGGDNRKLDAALDSTHKKLKDTGKIASETEAQVSTSGRKMALAFTAAASAIAYAFKKVMDSATELRRLSEQTGESTESLSILKVAAEGQGIAFDQLTAAIRQYNQTTLEMAREPTSKARQALSLLGIDAKTGAGEFKSFSQILREVSPVLEQYKDGTNKAQLTTAIFGNELGGRLIPLMKTLARDGWAAAAEEAKKYGLILDADGRKKSEEFEKASRDLTRAIEGFRKAMMAAAPAVTAVLNAVTWLIDKMKEVDVFQTFADQIKKLSTEELDLKLATTRDQLEQLGAASNQTREDLSMLERLGLKISISADRARLEQELIELEAELKNRSVSVPLVVDIRSAAPALDTVKNLRDQVDALTERLQGMPFLFSEMVQGANPTPFTEQYQQAFDLIDRATAASAISAQQATKIKLGLQKQEQSAILDTASMAASTLTAVFGKSKAAGIAAAIINTGVGVTKALSGSVPPFNFIQAGLVAAAGAAQIATIRSTSEKGGGSVAGVGAGGAAAASAQESAPAASSGSASPPSGTMTVRGFKPSEWFSGDGIKDVVEGLLQYQRDGGRVVLA